MIYGYARISNIKQNIERQTRNILRSFPEAELIEEAFTGTSIDRPQWKRLRNKVQRGDVIVFDSVSRMSRNAEEGIRTYLELMDAGVDLVFIKEPHINTETYRKATQESLPMTGTDIDFILEGVNKYILALAREQIRLAFGQAEKEVKDLRQRTREGIETARLNGKQIGHPEGTTYETKKSKEMKQNIRKMSRYFEGTLKDGDCIRILGIAYNTFYKYKRQMIEENLLRDSDQAQEE